MSTSEGKCVLVEVGALISWCIYSNRIVMLLVPYMWASMTFLPMCDIFIFFFLQIEANLFPKKAWLSTVLFFDSNSP